MLNAIRWFLLLSIGVAIAKAPTVAPEAPTTSQNEIVIAEVRTENRAPVGGGVWDGYPMLKKMCSCESTAHPDREPRQFYQDGSVLWGQDKGKIVERDVGACQINTYAHAEELGRLGLDVVHSFADNVKFAKILYDRNGTRDWTASKECWK